MQHKNKLSGYKVVHPTRDARKKKEYWQTAIGLSQADGLESLREEKSDCSRNMK